MAKKRETIDTGPLLSALQRVGWFRKINDTVQVGIPDLIGTHEGDFCGIEVKAIRAVPEDGIVPPLNMHTFSAKQVHDLKGINKNGGFGVGVIICGKSAAVVTPDRIDKNGQTNWHKANCYIHKEGGEWNLERLLWMKKIYKERS
jgi:hypothetical protein